MIIPCDCEREPKMFIIEWLAQLESLLVVFSDTSDWTDGNSN
jgi:hypothetical protein